MNSHSKAVLTKLTELRRAGFATYSDIPSPVRLLRQKNRSVRYFGDVLFVPSWARWIAVDNNGYAFAFENRPSPVGTEWEVAKGGAFALVAEFEIADNSCRAWLNTLQEVPA